MTPFVAAVDWGTSSFRLWLMAQDGAVLGETRSDGGMMKAMSVGFRNVLERHLAELNADPDLPVIICGMAGARQGWREAAYVDAPAALNEIGNRALRVDDGPRDVRILPGVAQRDPDWPDVIRGEETQLLGLVSQGVRSGLVCMPGTHSKWVSLKDGAIERFSTFMTGDMFQALASQSILRLAVEAQPDAVPDDGAYLDTFLDTVLRVFAAPARALPQLFAIRAGPLLGLRDGSEGSARLSGLLIGLELAGARASFEAVDNVMLVASGRLGTLYRAALDAAGLDMRVFDADEAVRAGLLAAAQAVWGKRP